MTTTRDAAQTIEARKARYSRELAAYTLRQWDLVRDTVGSTNGHNDRDKSSTPSASSRQVWVVWRVDISGKIITHLLHKSFYRAKVESFDTRAIGIVLQLYDWSGPVYRKALPEGMCRVIRDLYCEFAVRKGD
ncbi:hypothetical protein BC628DRAFT_1496751 [Trametes gibbosa]|nr:hypothetical protein BC628DRAFT_1496751 [Trametes gibbosa]